MVLILVLLTAVAAFGQTPSTSSSSSADQPISPGIRRFSIGAKLSVQILKAIKNDTVGRSETTPTTIDALYDTTGNFKRIGYGLTGQVMLTNRIGLSADLLMFRAGYVATSDVFEGVDNPRTTADDRVHTIRSEDTRFRYYDLPVTARFYSRGRRSRRPQWFGEAGLSWRRISNIKTTLDSSVNGGDVVTTNVPASPAKRTVRGFTAGFGVFAIDPFGIRVVPMVRYTRWMSEVFNNFSTRSERNQAEAGIAITF